jgi:hypothetical protein
VKSRHLLALLILAGMPAAAQFRVTATHDGRALADAEICFYHAESADPRVGLLKPGLQCYPAGKTLDLPARTFGSAPRRCWRRGSFR